MILQDCLQLITALTALVAVIVGPYISLKVANKQTSSTELLGTQQISASLETANLQARTAVLSKNRQDWINELRKEISEFIVHVHQMRDIAAQVRTEDRVKLLIESMDKLYLDYAKANLLINPTESGRAEIIKIMKHIHAGLKVKGFDFMKAERELIDLSQVVLKREWVRVKEFA